MEGVFLKFTHFLIIFGLGFLAYSLLNPYPHGMDSYYFLSAICTQGNLSGETVLTTHVFNLIPCNLGIIRAIQFIMSITAIVAITKTASIFHKQNYLLAAPIIFFAPVFLVEFAKLESELFAFPILFWSNYFLLKGLKEQKLKPQLIALALVAFASLLWQGAVYYLIPFGIMSIVFAPGLMTVIILYRDKMTQHLASTSIVWENSPWVGGTFLGLFCITFFGLIFEPLILFPGLYWLAIIFVNGKYAIHAIPFLTVGVLNLFNHPNLNRLDTKYNQPIWATVKLSFILSGFAMMLVILSILAFAWPPTTGQITLVREFVLYQDMGFDSKNDWSYGYWVRYWGGEPTAWGGGEWVQDYNSGVILTGKDLNCLEQGRAREMALYICSG